MYCTDKYVYKPYYNETERINLSHTHAIIIVCTELYCAYNSCSFDSKYLLMVCSKFLNASCFIETSIKML